MSSFVVGQRWISEAEPELGLGLIIKVENRRVAIHFPASSTDRQYALDSAPIQRVRFKVGDRIEDESGRSLTVERTEESNGLISYLGEGVNLPETHLSGTIRFSKPEARLLAGHWDSMKSFELRYRTLRNQHAIRRSPARGFLGARIALIPHQLFIAQEVASRQLPRALLADEVGLGKTIEAGLVLHRLLRSAQMHRVLILVPDSLVHQWFVEMFRRFHLSFSVLDGSHWNALEPEEREENPFVQVQTVVASLDFLAAEPQAASLALDCEWDLLVVDEAHHLEWTPVESSPEYRLVASLAESVTGLMLLTATPEQLGEEGHFARLRLLDPDRYPDYDSFCEEAERYRRLAPLAAKLLDSEPLDRAEQRRMVELFPEKAVSLRESFAALMKGDERVREGFIADLLDQHGPGRVLFRNSRKVLAQFPERRLRGWELVWPEGVGTERHFERLAKEFATDTRDTGLRVDYDFGEDVRLLWLADWLREHPKEKALVICRYQEKAVSIQEALRARTNIVAAVFHEALSLLQRDRNAAWFAEPDGAPILICSEIGSEGRNFQFAHHLVLFDLPLDAELLEQRIGRLDRIGQEHAVDIHVPYLPGTAQEMLVLWFHRGLDAFETPLPSSQRFVELAERLRDDALRHLEGGVSRVSTRVKLKPLLEETCKARAEVTRLLEQGRDRLLELTSYRSDPARSLMDVIEAWDEDRELDHYVTEALDHFGVEVEEVGSRSFVVRQGNQLTVDRLQGLRSEEVAMTCDRTKAQQRGELDFLTWDHPMVTGVMELIAGGERGNSSVASLAVPGGGRDGDGDGLLLETIFVLDAVAPPELYLDRFLPPTPIRFVIDGTGKDVTAIYPSARITPLLEDARNLMRYRNRSHWDVSVPAMLASASQAAAQASTSCIEASLRDMTQHLGTELRRLLSLKEVNDHVHQEEIDHARLELEACAQAIRSATPRLDSLRLITIGS